MQLPPDNKKWGVPHNGILFHIATDPGSECIQNTDKYNLYFPGRKVAQGKSRTFFIFNGYGSQLTGFGNAGEGRMANRGNRGHAVFSSLLSSIPIEKIGWNFARGEVDGRAALAGHVAIARE
jgi:hypothetical protein